MQSVELKSAEKNFKLSQIDLPVYSKPDFTQKQTEEELTKIVTQSFLAGERFRAQYATNWTDFKRKFIGDFYKNKQRFGYECRPNKYLEKVEQLATLLTQVAFKDYVVRGDESNSAEDVKPDIFTRIIADVKKKGEFNVKAYRSILFGGIYGPGIIKTFFDRNADKGRGYPNFKNIRPQQFVVSPGATSLDDATFMGTKSPVATVELQRLYPQFKDRLKSDPGLNLGDLYGQDVVENAGLAVSDSRTGAVAYLESLKSSHGIGKSADQTYLYEFYYRDPRWQEIKDENELKDWIEERPGFGNEYFKQQAFDEYSKNGFPQNVKLYPHGRIIFMASNCILEDHANPYPWTPYDDWMNHIDPDVFWGKGTIELISEAMASYQMVTSSVAAQAIFRNIPPWWTDDQQLDDNKFKKVQPGTLLHVSPGRQVQPLNVPGIPITEMEQLLNRREQEADTVSGVSSILSGSRPTGVFAGSYFNSLQDSAYKGLTPFVDRWRTMNEKIGQKVLWLIQNYVTDERIIPFVNDEEKSELIKINQMALDTSDPMQLKLYRRNNIGAGQFIYLIEGGSGQPFNLVTRQQQCLEMSKLLIQQGFEMPAIRLLLESSGLPGWRKMLRELEQMYQSKMQAGAQQQQTQQQQVAQARMDKLNTEEAKLDTKIKVAQIAAESSTSSAANNPETSPEEVAQIFQVTVARMLQEGVPVDQIMQEVLKTGVAAGRSGPPIGQSQGPTGFQAGAPPDITTNLGPLTPRVPTDIMPMSMPQQPPAQQ